MEAVFQFLMSRKIRIFAQIFRLYMAAIFRFSNAVSDIDKLMQTFRLLVSEFGELADNDFFDHNQAAKFLAENGLASSLGAIGSEAIARSFSAENTSLNPLYNQHKSYSEFFRMLGWYVPGTKQTNFRISEFGKIIGDPDLPKESVRKLVEKCVLHIVSPNPFTNIKGGNILRPFPLLLKLMAGLDGYILRDEIILGVLACQNDRNSETVSDAITLIKKIRANGYKALNDAIMDLREANGVYHYKDVNGKKTRVFAPLGKDTLPNYTRLPIALCKWLGWAEEVNTKSIYKNKTVHALQATPYGLQLAQRLSEIPDIRFAGLETFDKDSVIAFAAYSNLYQLSVAYNCFEDYSNVLPSILDKATPVFQHFNFSPLEDEFLFFAYQEMPLHINQQADELLDTI